MPCTSAFPRFALPRITSSRCHGSLETCIYPQWSWLACFFAVFCFFARFENIAMAAQVPPDALGSAIAVLVYSLICLFSGFFFLWMVWVHDERKSCG